MVYAVYMLTSSHYLYLLRYVANYQYNCWTQKRAKKNWRKKFYINPISTNLRQSSVVTSPQNKTGTRLKAQQYSKVSQRQLAFMPSWHSLESPSCSCAGHVRFGSHSRASTGRETMGIRSRWVTSQRSFRQSLSGFPLHSGRISCPIHRHAAGSGCGDTQEAVRHHQERPAEVQWTGKSVNNLDMLKLCWIPPAACNCLL